MKRALVLLVLVAACGGSSDGGSADPKAAYLAKAEAVCVGANAQIDTAKKEQPADVAAVPAYVHRLVDLAKETLSQMTLLTPPAADEADIKAKLLTPLGQQVDDAQAFAVKVDAAAAAKDTQQLTSLIFNPPTATRVDLDWMRGYGFKACVKAADTGAATK